MLLPGLFTQQFYSGSLVAPSSPFSAVSFWLRCSSVDSERPRLALRLLLLSVACLPVQNQASLPIASRCDEASAAACRVSPAPLTVDSRFPTTYLGACISTASGDPLSHFQPVTLAPKGPCQCCLVVTKGRGRPPHYEATPQARSPASAHRAFHTSFLQKLLRTPPRRKED